MYFVYVRGRFDLEMSVVYFDILISYVKRSQCMCTMNTIIPTRMRAISSFKAFIKAKLT